MRSLFLLVLLSPASIDAGGVWIAFARGAAVAFGGFLKNADRPSWLAAGGFLRNAESAPATCRYAGANLENCRVAKKFFWSR